MSALIEMIQFKIEATKFFGKTNPAYNDPRHMAIEKFLLEFGTPRRGQRLPREYRAGPQKQCFMNAYRLADQCPELRYVEGFGSRDGLPMEFRHAWCETADGRVIDPTWRNTSENETYVGVVIPREVRVRETARSGYYGVLWLGPWDTPNFNLLPKLEKILRRDR